MHYFVSLPLILAFSVPIQAATLPKATPSETGETSAKPADDKKTATDPTPGSSRFNRQGKVADLLLAAGWDTFERNGSSGSIMEYRNGLVGSIYLSPDTKLGLGLFGGNAVNRSKVGFDYVDVKGTLSVLGVGVTHFLGNSFKVNSEANYRTIDFSGIKLSAAGVSVGFGNQWSWDSFTLSWDWIRYTKNVSLKYDKLDVLDQYPGGFSAALSTIALGWAW